MKHTMNAAYIKDRPDIGLLGDKIVTGTSIPVLDPSNLKPDQLLINVKASSMNVDDLHLAEGVFLGGMPGMQTNEPSDMTPLILGSDFAGVIVAVGSKVGDSFQVGQRVCGLNKRMFGEDGTWAEYTVAGKDHVVSIPDHISFVEAAALVMPLHVIHGLIEAAKLEDGKRVLVVGASGGIGSTLVPILRHLYPKLDIVGVCGSKNVAFVKELGATSTVDYSKGPIEDELGKSTFDVVFDIVGGVESHSTGKALLKPKGRYVTPVGPIAWIGDKKLTFGEKMFFVLTILGNTIKNILPGSHSSYHMVAPVELSGTFFALMFDTNVRAHISQTVEFENKELVKAIELVQSHRARGKVILKIT